MGLRDGEDILVVKASDSGPNAKRSHCGFLRDTAFCQAVLNEEHAVSGADYVGEWHTHVIDLRGPSRGDLETLAGIILDPDYSFRSFAMILLVVSGRTTQILGYVAYTESAGVSPKFASIVSAVPIVEMP
jgi:integrative and conjugative element protein (TIGR02256 family)